LSSVTAWRPARLIGIFTTMRSESWCQPARLHLERLDFLQPILWRSAPRASFPLRNWWIRFVPSRTVASSPRLDEERRHGRDRFILRLSRNGVEPDARCGLGARPDLAAGDLRIKSDAARDADFMIRNVPRMVACPALGR